MQQPKMLLSQHHNMVHEDLPNLKILLHVMVSVNHDAQLKDHCKAEINASKKLY